MVFCYGLAIDQAGYRQEVDAGSVLNQSLQGAQLAQSALQGHIQTRQVRVIAEC